jgi:hypothetical protein
VLDGRPDAVIFRATHFKVPVTSTPVVLLIYRRPDLTRQIVERVAAARPSLLLVVADGPRSDAEVELCAEARRVVERVKWPAEVIWNASDVNLGLRKRVSSGLDWAFSLVERAIILEDDCLPEVSFFPYCEAMLDRYRDDLRVMQIAGSSLTPHVLPDGSSYYFSKHFHPWGWATWRRAWGHYDEAISSWPDLKRRSALSFDSWVEKRFWSTVFDRLHDRQLDTWDYQWFFAMLTQKGLSTVPSVNLVANIGFGPGGTHYHQDHHFGAIPVGSIDSIVHPRFVIRDIGADRDEFRAAGPPLLRLARVELGRLRHRMRSRSVDPR